MICEHMMNDKNNSHMHTTTTKTKIKSTHTTDHIVMHARMEQCGHGHMHTFSHTLNLISRVCVCKYYYY